MLPFPSHDPVENRTLVYSETLSYWFELSSGTDSDFIAEWYGNSVTYCYGKNLVTDHRNGNTYELDAETYTDNSDARLWVLGTRNFTADDIQGSGRITARQAFFNMQVGVGLATGQGVDPVLLCQFSAEGGEVYLTQQQVKMGVMGEYKKRVQFDQFANGYQIRLKVMGSDPVPITMWQGEIDLIPGGY